MPHRWGALACLYLLVAGFAPAAQAEPRPVALELALAVDASASVNPAEFALQLHGIAQAFRDPDIHAAIETAAGNGLAVALLEWSGPTEQRLTVGWSLVADADGAVAFAARVASAKRHFAGVTAIGEALRFAGTALATNAYLGERLVVDVSGDGATNYGRRTGPIRDRLVAAGVTVNGLAITNEEADLTQFYREHVAGGPGAFVATATDYADFAQAIRGKLIQEILGRPLF